MTKRMLQDNPGLRFALAQITKNLSGGGKQNTGAVTRQAVHSKRLVDTLEIPLPAGKISPAQTYPIQQEVVIQVTRYGEAGEPVQLRLLCTGRYNRETFWDSFPEGEVVEGVGDFHVGELIPLSLEELAEVSREAEQEYNRPDEPSDTDWQPGDWPSIL